MKKNDADPPEFLTPTRFTLFSDAIIFQIKLGLDAGRDLILSPIAIVCTVIDLIRGPGKKRGYFHRLMNIGHRTDVWLNLFGPHSLEQAQENKAEKEQTTNDLSVTPEVESNVDQLIFTIETILKEQHSQGGLTASAKLAIDSYLEKIHKAENVQPKNSNRPTK
ncbi:MAG: hypothetical protein V7459_03680 [Oceanicoccus sp.]